MIEKIKEETFALKPCMIYYTPLEVNETYFIGKIEYTLESALKYCEDLVRTSLEYLYDVDFGTITVIEE